MADQNKIDFTVRVTEEGVDKLAAGLERINEQATEVGKAGEVAGAGVDKLATAADKAGTELEQLAAAEDKAQQQSDELKSSSDAAAQEVADLGQQADKAGTELEQLATAEDKAQQQSTQLGSSTNTAGQALTDLAGDANQAQASVNQLGAAEEKAQASGKQLGTSADQADQAVTGMGQSSAKAADQLEQLVQQLDRETAQIKAGLELQRSEIELQNRKLELQRAEQQELIKSAQARGNEAQAQQAQVRLREIESEQLRLVAQAKRAEAQAIAQSAQASRDELSARGPITKAQADAIAAAENHAKSLRVEAAAADKAAAQLHGYGKSADVATGHIHQLGKVGDDLKTKLTGVAAAVGGLFAAAQLKDFALSAIETADAYGQMSERIKMATPVAAEYNLVQKRILEAANLTYRPLKEQQTLYIETADALREMGYATKDGSFVLSLTDTTGAKLTANVDGHGNITGPHMRGKIEFARGGVDLLFGDYVLDADLTPEQKREWWYNAADVGAVQPARIWRPWPVDPTTLTYSAVGTAYLPVDVSLMGLDPAALPADGRVPFARPGDTCVIGLNIKDGSPFVPVIGNVYSLGHERLSFVQVLNAATGAEIRKGYTASLDAGTVTFNDLTDYPAQVRIIGRVEVRKEISEVRIDGRVRLTQPIGYAFEPGAVFSTCLDQGDRFARVSRTYAQKTWDGVSWVDGLVGDRPQANYDTKNNKIIVTNRGSVKERWACKFRADGINFDFVGQHLGQIGNGNINEDFSPMNMAAGVPYLTIPAGGWGMGWGPNNTFFIDTEAAAFPIAVVRCTQPGSPAGLDDSFWLVQRGGVDNDPGTTF